MSDSFQESVRTEALGKLGQECIERAEGLQKLLSPKFSGDKPDFGRPLTPQELLLMIELQMLGFELRSQDPLTFSAEQQGEIDWQEIRKDPARWCVSEASRIKNKKSPAAAFEVANYTETAAQYTNAQKDGTIGESIAKVDAEIRSIRQTVAG